MACAEGTIKNSIVIYIALPYALHVVQGPKEAQGSPSTHPMHTERQWTSSSRDAPARKDAVVTGASVTRKETTVALQCECQGCVNIPLQQPATSATNTRDSSSTCNSTSSDETDDVENIETEVVTMEELIFDQVDIV